MIRNLIFAILWTIVLSLIFTITIYKFKIRKLRKILHDFEKANNL